MFARGFSGVRRVLCLGAHADDIEIGCGGTLLRLLAEQPEAQIQWVVFSAAGERRDEALHGAELFLAGSAKHEVVIHDFPDRLFPTAWEPIKQQFDALRASFSPDLVFTHRRDDAHQDHRVVADLTWCTYRDHWVLEYEIPKYEGDLGNPNVFAPLTRDQLERKVACLTEAFASQRDKPWFLPDTFRGLASLRGLECRAAESLAEGFYCRKLTL